MQYTQESEYEKYLSKIGEGEKRRMAQEEIENIKLHPDNVEYEARMQSLGCNLQNLQSRFSSIGAGIGRIEEHSIIDQRILQRELGDEAFKIFHSQDFASRLSPHLHPAIYSAEFLEDLASRHVGSAFYDFERAYQNTDLGKLLEELLAEFKMKLEKSRAKTILLQHQPYFIEKYKLNPQPILFIEYLLFNTPFHKIRDIGDSVYLKELLIDHVVEESSQLLIIEQERAMIVSPPGPTTMTEEKPKNKSGRPPKQNPFHDRIYNKYIEYTIFRKSPMKKNLAVNRLATDFTSEFKTEIRKNIMSMIYRIIRDKNKINKQKLT